MPDLTARQMRCGWEKTACQQAPCQHEGHKKLRSTIAYANHTPPSPTMSVQSGHSRRSNRVHHRCLPRGFKPLAAHSQVNVCDHLPGVPIGFGCVCQQEQLSLRLPQRKPKSRLPVRSGPSHCFSSEIEIRWRCVNRQLEVRVDCAHASSHQLWLV